jgi:hypothetical protein
MKKGAHSIGVIFDKGMEEELRIRHLQVIDAARATLGINIPAVAITSTPLGIDTRISEESGASWGSVEETKSLIDAAEYLVHEKHCTAIAVIGRFPEDEEIDSQQDNNNSNSSNSSEDNDNSSKNKQSNFASLSAVERFAAYRAGEGVDTIAGVEAIISHIISHRLHIPCAHAPAFATVPLEMDTIIAPKACAEEIGYTFLPCVLSYLHRAPKIIPYHHDADGGGENKQDILTADDVDAVVVPVSLFLLCCLVRISLTTIFSSLCFINCLNRLMLWEDQLY